MEDACKIIYYTRISEMHKATGPKAAMHEYRKHSDEYKKWCRNPAGHALSNQQRDAK